MTLTPEKLAELRQWASEGRLARPSDVLMLLDALEACGSKAASSALSEAKRELVEAAIQWHFGKRSLSMLGDYCARVIDVSAKGKPE